MNLGKTVHWDGSCNEAFIYIKKLIDYSTFTITMSVETSIWRNIRPQIKVPLVEVIRASNFNKVV